MQVVPLQPQPNQTLQVQLNGQACTIDVLQMAYGLFVTIYVGDRLIISNVIALNLTRIVRSAYLGFSGDFAFCDTQGSDDPVYTGLGGLDARYQLIYLEPADLPAES